VFILICLKLVGFIVTLYLPYRKYMILHVQHAVHQHAARTTLASDASIIAEDALQLGSLFISETAAFAFPACKVPLSWIFHPYLQSDTIEQPH
jgi:hypothetical protein